MRSDDDLSDAAKIFKEVKEERGIDPEEFASFSDYTEAVIRSEDNESLKEFAEFTSSPRIQGIIKDELTKRGEI